MSTAKIKNEGLRLIITGCGASGTRYLAAVLNAAGFTAGHEDMISLRGLHLPKKIPDGLVEVSWLATSLLTPSRPPAIENAIIWHVVRNPFKVANTFSRKGFFSHRGDPYLETVLAAEGVNIGDTHPELDYWIDWNALAEKGSTKTFQLETVRDDLTSFLKDAAAAVGMPFKNVDIEAAHRVGLQGVSGWDMTYTADGYSRLGELIDAAKSYGYDLGLKKPRAKKAKPTPKED